VWRGLREDDDRDDEDGNDSFKFTLGSKVRGNVPFRLYAFCVYISIGIVV
jgi:hypothetical protein